MYRQVTRLSPPHNTRIEEETATAEYIERVTKQPMEGTYSDKIKLRNVQGG